MVSDVRNIAYCLALYASATPVISPVCPPTPSAPQEVSSRFNSVPGSRVHWIHVRQSAFINVTFTFSYLCQSSGSTKNISSLASLQSIKLDLESNIDTEAPIAPSDTTITNMTTKPHQYNLAVPNSSAIALASIITFSETTAGLNGEHQSSTNLGSPFGARNQLHEIFVL